MVDANAARAGSICTVTGIGMAGNKPIPVPGKSGGDQVEAGTRRTFNAARDVAGRKGSGRDNDWFGRVMETGPFEMGWQGNDAEAAGGASTT